MIISRAGVPREDLREKLQQKIQVGSVVATPKCSCQFACLPVSINWKGRWQCMKPCSMYDVSRMLYRSEGKIGTPKRLIGSIRRLMQRSGGIGSPARPREREGEVKGLNA